MLFIFLLILFVVLIAVNVRIVPEKRCCVIERLGKYQTTWESGIHVKIPLIDKIVKTISLKEQVLDFPPQPVITKDNVTVQIDSVVYAYVFNPKLYTYGVENPMLGLQNMTATTLRNIIGDMELDETLTSRESINSQMQTILDEVTDPWGMKVKAVEIKNINPPAEIEEVMTTQMRAERERRQTMLEAQAHKESIVQRAEGDKKAKILAAEAMKESQLILASADAERIRVINEAEVAAANRLRDAGVADVVIKLRNINALRDVADGQATKIVIPTDVTDGLAAAAAFGAAINGESVQTKPRAQYREGKAMQAGAAGVAKDACIGPESSKTTVGVAAQNARNRHVLKEIDK